MDTLTHALSGALLARASAPRDARISVAARVGAGFFACAFPDGDWVLRYVSPITYLTQHRGVTHSIFLLPVWALVLAWLFARIDRDKQVWWRDYFGVCLLALGQGRDDGRHRAPYGVCAALARLLRQEAR